MKPLKSIAVVASMIIGVLITQAQQVQLKPYAGLHVSLNYVPKATLKALGGPVMNFQPQRVVPEYGLSMAYIDRKHWGVSAGVLYNKFYSRITSVSIKYYTAEFKFHDYNLWFPLKVLYELPFSNGERAITFGLGGFIGYHHYLFKKVECNLLSSYGFTGSPIDTVGIGVFNPNDHLSYLQSGINLGFELQPFRKSKGLTIGVEYSHSFMNTMKRVARTVVSDNVTGNSTQLFVLDLRQQNIAFRLAYTFSVGKHSNSDRWRFLNMVRETDSAYYRLYKTPLNEVELEVPTVSLNPYVHLHAGWAQQIITGKQKPASQRMSYNGAAFGYGITTGINYLWQQNTGVGMGFTYYMSSYRLKTMPSAITAFGDSYHSWSTTYSQYLFHINFVYRHYWQKNYRHVEFVPSLMLGLNRYFSFGYSNMVVSSSTLNNPDFNQSYPEDFRFQFTSGLSNSFSVHPFAKNTGLKFGINYQIDFVRLLPVTYQSTFSNNNNAEVDYREVTIQPLPSKLSFTISYSPVIKLKGKK